MGAFAVVLLAVALSIDSLGVGVAYGMRKVEVAFLPMAIIVFCSVVAMTISLFTGNLVAGFMPRNASGYAGGAILISIGLWQLLQGLKKYQSDKSGPATEEKNGAEGESTVVLKFDLKIFGLVLQILREPQRADLDKSGDIGCKEAFLLGVALNIDAMGAGLGAGMAGCSLFLIPAVAIALLITLYLGMWAGKKCAATLSHENGFVLPALVLICLGLLKIFKWQ